MKTCFKCGIEKPLADYYKHKGMADGHLNKCKECTKADSRATGQTPKAKERDRNRNRAPHRIEAQAEHQRQKRKECNAKNAVHRAVKCGKMTRPDTCSACGVECKPDGHHDDYDKPLDVRWLCRACHKQHHAKNDRPTTD